MIVDEQTKTLLGGGTIEELKGIATKFKDGGGLVLVYLELQIVFGVFLVVYLILLEHLLECLAI